MFVNPARWRRRTLTLYALVGLFFVLALVVTLGRGSLVSAAQTDIRSKYIEGDLPVDDPASAVWGEAPQIEVPVSVQNVTPPFNLKPSVQSLKVRSVHNGEVVAFRIEWDDDTRDVGGGVVDYRDSVALQFPVQGGEPFVCMGFADAEVNILHWRADFQHALENGGGAKSITDIFPNADMNIYPQAEDVNFTTARAAGNPLAASAYPSAVEDLRATGFGTLKAQDQIDTTGWANWDGEKWHAVIARPLATGDAQDAQLEPGMRMPLALAVWDGDQKDVNGKKSVSAWVSVGLDQLTGEPAPEPAEAPAPAASPAATEAPAAHLVPEEGGGTVWWVVWTLVGIVAGVIIIPSTIALIARRGSAS